MLNLAQQNGFSDIDKIKTVKELREKMKKFLYDKIYCAIKSCRSIIGTGVDTNHLPEPIMTCLMGFLNDDPFPTRET